MYVTKQLLLELCFTGSIRNFQFLLFTLMFQETYNTVLWAARDAIFTVVSFGNSSIFS